jgi:putative acetyltransferase
MYLGRCMLGSDRAVAELTEVLKHHARVMVAVQDDDFFNPYRGPQREPGTCSVYQDWPEDGASVAAVHEQAFGREDEARMVAAVRTAGVPTVSLLADLDRQIIGHVLLSPVTIHGTDSAPALRGGASVERSEPLGLGLAPLAVLPAHQRRGVGSQLVREALRTAQLLGYAYAVVLGDPAYYQRLGFVPASRFGLRYEHRVPADAFMAQELRADALKGASGVVRYLPAFSATAGTRRAD